MQLTRDATSPALPYAPSGNGIVERNHRTIKRIAARGNITPEEATYWYNVTPRQDDKDSTVPCRRLFKYSWRVPYDTNVLPEENGKSKHFKVGGEVWVKPSVPSCTKRWALGQVTRVISSHVVAIDGTPRHVRDLRKYVPPTEGMAPLDQRNLHMYDGAYTTPTEALQRIEVSDDVIIEEPQVVMVEEAEPEPGPRRSGRLRRPPQWMDDYVP